MITDDMRYVALLRGINVTGKNMIKMETLRATFESLGFENVKSYISSGNLAFDISKSDALMPHRRFGERDRSNVFLIMVIRHPFNFNNGSTNTRSCSGRRL